MKTKACIIPASRIVGFTLMEVMIAMGIFLVGIVAIAAVFPTGVALQRQAVDDMTAQDVVRRAKAQILAIAQDELDSLAPFWPLSYIHDFDNPAGPPVEERRKGTLVRYSELDLSLAPEGGDKVYSMILLQNPGDPVRLRSPFALNGVFPLSMRSHPVTIEMPRDRIYFWYPLVKSEGLTTIPPGQTTDGSEGQWRCFIVVLKRDSSKGVPELRQIDAQPDLSAISRIRFLNPSDFVLGATNTTNDTDNDALPDLIRPGDWVLDNEGFVHRVILADNRGLTVDSPVISTQINHIYYGVHTDAGGNGDVVVGARSPVVRIEEFNLTVQKP